MRTLQSKRMRSAGGGLIGTVIAVIVVAGLYVGAEWWVTQDTQANLSTLLSEGRSRQVEVAAVGLDGWLLSSRRTGTALITTAGDKQVPVEFVLTGNPVTGATISIRDEDQLKLMVREWLDVLR